MIRDKASGKLVEAGWDEALDLVATRLKQIKAEHGANSIAGIGSARCTNEDNYLLQKLMRAAIGTNNLDNCTRFEHAPTLTVLDDALGWPAMSNSFADVANSPVMLLVGVNPTETHPVFGIQIRRAAKEGRTRLIIVEPRHTKLTKYAKPWLPVKPGTDVALICGMIHVLIKEDLIDKKFIKKFTVGFEKLTQAVKKYTPAYTARITGLAKEQIIEAARIYGKAPSAAIIYGMGATQHTWGINLVYNLANLALITGNMGKPGGGLNPLRGQNNTQGACDMGVLPDFYPGYQQVADPQTMTKLEKLWGVKLPKQDGLTLTQMLPAIEDGRLKAMYIMGENPVLSSPNPKQVQKSLAKLDLLVVQDIFPNEITAVADVVLPGTSFAEKDGTFTNTERRIQRVHKAIQPVGNSRPDWKIISQLANRLGYEMVYADPAHIMEEIHLVVPIYAGINYSRLGAGGIQWPCADSDHPGTPVLYTDGPLKGKAKLVPVEYEPASQLTSKEYPYLLLTGKWLFHYHTGVLTKRTEALMGVPEQGLVEINPEDAEKMGISDGSKVTVKSAAGQVKLIARLSEDSPAGTLFMPVHFGQAEANLLFNPSMDAVSHIPELKLCAVNISPIS
jgi:formate dehydrogenase alpha subunit